jgi:hypothetical protein
MGGLKWVAVILIIVIIALVWYYRPKPPLVTTDLELESVGGFAYIHSRGAPEVNVAFLKSVDVADCKVEQLGVELMVVSGVVTSVTGGPDPTLPPALKRRFELQRATVRFPDLAKSSHPLVVNRSRRPTGPFGPGQATEWADVRWVPGIRYNVGTTSGQPTADYPQSTLHPDWPNMVDGRVVLSNGTMSAGHPSDVAVQDSIFEFKTPGGTGPSYKQAVTDSTVFRARVPSNQIVINLTGAASTVTQIVIQPTEAGRAVRLKMKGRHAEQTPPVLPIGEPVHHYCAFYQLLDPIPAHNLQLIPQLFSGPIASSTLGGQPSPGAYCPGEWYPE